jgi:RimJ/RimL family protein N-acetyltransferase
MKTKLRFKYLHKGVFNWQNIEFVREVRSDVKNDDNVLMPKRLTRVEQEQWFWDEYSKIPDWKIWVVYDESLNSPIGYVHYSIDNLYHRRCEVKHLISSRYNRLKYDSAVIKWMINNVNDFEENIHRLWIPILVHNTYLINIYANNGFEVDGLLRDYAQRDNKYYDVYILSYLV